MKSKKLNPNGFTLLEFVVGIGLVSAVTLMVANLSYTASRTNHSMAEKTTTFNFRTTLLSTIENPIAWQMTVQKNPGMACLVNGSDCAGVSGGAFNVFDNGGALFYGPEADDAAGFTISGDRCTGYPDENGCEFRYDLSWSAVCPAGTECLNPLVLITGELRHPLGTSPLNLAELSFRTFRSFLSNTVERNCLSIGGSLDPLTQKCVSHLQAQRCEDGKIVVGVQVNGTLLCAPPFSQRCSSGLFLAGFDPVSGGALCQDKVTRFPTSLPPSPLPSNNDCPAVGHVQGDKWWVDNGKDHEPVACLDKDGKTGQQFKVFDKQIELTCSFGRIEPSGTTKRTDSGLVEGACVFKNCPSGAKEGDIFWELVGTSNETVQCATTKKVNSQATYNIMAEYQCSKGQAIATSMIKKEIVSETPCPPMTFSDMSTSTTLAYEDLYPFSGDADYNDVGLSMDAQERYNSLEELVSISLSFQSTVAGGGLATASVLVFDGHVRGPSPAIGASFDSWTSNVNGFVSDSMFDGTAKVTYELLDKDGNSLQKQEDVPKDKDLIIFPSNAKAFTEKQTAKITVTGIDPKLNFLLKREKLSILRYRVVARILGWDAANPAPTYDLDLADINPTMFSDAPHMPMGFFVPKDWCPPKEGRASIPAILSS